MFLGGDSAGTFTNCAFVSNNAANGAKLRALSSGRYAPLKRQSRRRHLRQLHWEPWYFILALVIHRSSEPQRCDSNCGSPFQRNSVSEYLSLQVRV